MTTCGNSKALGFSGSGCEFSASLLPQLPARNKGAALSAHQLHSPGGRPLMLAQEAQICHLALTGLFSRQADRAAAGLCCSCPGDSVDSGQLECIQYHFIQASASGQSSS